MSLKFWMITGIALLVPAIVSVGKADAYNATDLSRVRHKLSCVKCDLSGADLVGVSLNGLDLSGSNLSNANLSGALMRGTVLVETNLTNSNMSRVKLNGANMRRANLDGAVWQDSDWRGAIVPDGRIFGADNSGFNPTIQYIDNRQNESGTPQTSINQTAPAYQGSKPRR